MALKRIKEFNRREDQNILKLEIDKIMTENIKISERNRQLSVLKTLNFLSLRSFSFTVLVEKEGSTNFFLKFLDFFNRNAGVS